MWQLPVWRDRKWYGVHWLRVVSERYVFQYGRRLYMRALLARFLLVQFITVVPIVCCGPLSAKRNINLVRPVWGRDVCRWSGFCHVLTVRAW